MSSLPLKVYVRTRPTTEFAADNLKIQDDHQTIEVDISKSEKLNFMNQPKSHYSYKFHNILHNVSQEILFEEAAREIVDSFVQGYHGAVFSFGQRGAGKTFTMFGDIRHDIYRGVVPRTVTYIFSELDKYKTTNMKLSVQFCHVYNDIIYDLLTDEEKEISVTRDKSGAPVLQNITLVQPNDSAHVIDLITEGNARLAHWQKKYNRPAYRGHVFFIFDLVSRKNTRMTESKLIMADIAATEECLDAAYVNKSMSYLQQLVISLSEKGEHHLPFRRSKLTYLLSGAIGGNCRTAAIANIWPEPRNNRETISTFNFASSLGKLKNMSKVNTIEPLDLQLERLESELDHLRAESEFQSELAGNLKVDGISQKEQEEIADLVSLYLSESIDDMPIKSLSHLKAIFAEIKSRYVDIPNAVMREISDKYILSERVKNNKAPKDVGTVDGGGFSIGVAGSQDRPNNARTSVRSVRHIQGGSNMVENPMSPTKDQMFEIYKMRDGQSLAKSLLEVKKETKALVMVKKETAEAINALQDKITSLSARIESEGLRSKNRLMVEEAELIQEEAKAKAEYKEKFAAIQKTQASIDELKEKSSDIRADILVQFENWYQKWLTNQLYTEPVVPPVKEADTAAGSKETGGNKSGKKPPLTKTTKGKALPKKK